MGDSLPPAASSASEKKAHGEATPNKVERGLSEAAGGRESHIPLIILTYRGDNVGCHGPNSPSWLDGRGALGHPYPLW